MKIEICQRDNYLHKKYVGNERALGGRKKQRTQTSREHNKFTY